MEPQLASRRTLNELGWANGGVMGNRSSQLLRIAPTRMIANELNSELTLINGLAEQIGGTEGAELLRSVARSAYWIWELQNLK